jgi:membrane fusion protein (multidrug efflux system)
MEATQQVGAPPVGGRAADVPATETATGPNPVLRTVGIVVGAIVLIVAIVAGIRFFLYASAHETTDDATIDADQVQVTSKISERVDRILVDTNQPVRAGQLLISLDDRDERDRVAAAQAAVDAQRAQARAAQANVSLAQDTQLAQNQQNSGSIAQAQAAIASAADQARSSAGQIAVAQASLDAAKAQFKAAQDAVPAARENLRKAAADLRRTTALVATGDVAAAQLDAARAVYASASSAYAQAQAQANAAQADVTQAQQKLDAQRFSTSSAQAQIGVSQAQLTTARGKFRESDAPSRVAAQQAQADAAAAEVASLDAQLVTAKNNLSYTAIRSPIDGYVGQKNVEVGQTVSPGESLLTLVPDRVYITANYKETQIGRMKVGQEVDINVDAYKGVKFVGHVDNLSPASQNTFSLVPPQNATGNFVKVTQRLPVRILFDRVEGGKLDDYALRPGMSVETSVKVK